MLKPSISKQKQSEIEKKTEAFFILIPKYNILTTVLLFNDKFYHAIGQLTLFYEF